MLRPRLFVQSADEFTAPFERLGFVYLLFFPSFRFFIHLGSGHANLRARILKHKPAEELWCAKLLVRAADSFMLFVDRLRSWSQNNHPQSQLSATLRVYGKGYSALLASTLATSRR